MAALWPRDRRPRPIDKPYNEMTYDERLEHSLDMYRSITNYYKKDESRQSKIDHDFDTWMFPRREAGRLLPGFDDPDYDTIQETDRLVDEYYARQDALQEQRERLLAPSPPATPPRSPPTLVQVSSDTSSNSDTSLNLNQRRQSPLSHTQALTMSRQESHLYDGPIQHTSSSKRLVRSPISCLPRSSPEEPLDLLDLPGTQLDYDPNDDGFYMEEYPYDLFDSSGRLTMITKPPVGLGTCQQPTTALERSFTTSQKVGFKASPSLRVTRSCSRPFELLSLASDGKTVIQARSQARMRSLRGSCTRRGKAISPKPSNKVSKRRRPR